MPTPLTGLRVLDLTRILAGPWATQTLADLGAEVIKVERPKLGDESRHYGPPFLLSGSGASTRSVYFLAANRGKRSVTINLATPEGQSLVRELAGRCDVLIENFKAGSLAKMGLGYAQLSASNPGLIYCSITGFGQEGPHRDRAGYDLVAQAMGGLMSITGEPDGPPVRVGVAITDILTGLYGAIGILSALRERERTGLGQYIDLALFDVQVATLANQASSFLATGQVPQRYGNAHANIVPYQSFATRNGYMIVAVANDFQFSRFAEILGMPQIFEDPRFRTNSERVRNRAVLLPIIADRLRERTTGEWLADCDGAHIPAAPINSLDAVFSDPQIEAHHLVVEFPPSGNTPVRVAGSPLRLSRTPVSYQLPPPELGAHTDEVLSELLGKTPESIEDLRRRGVL
ncbi:MAG TPA: CaiB/BaiF CoA-transferase family protein [Patescibacteria group bacterium]|nr:CaiB/BaiF CoA-transferase family protein [Patescibacteria group bacterium]